MGCKVSKGGDEPYGPSNILGCNKLSRSYSTPIQLASVQHSLQNPKCESFHIVSLTSSTYGSLPPDSTPLPEEERNKAGIGTTEQGGFEKIKHDRDLHATRVPHSWSHETDLQTVDPSKNALTEGEIPEKDADYKQEKTINMWELMESLEDKKAALHMLRGLMEKSRVSGLESGKSSPRMSTTIHTVEELDNILDVRRSYPTNHRLQRGPLREPLLPTHDSHKFELDSKKMHGTPFSIQLSQLSLAMEKSQGAKEFDSVRRKDFFQSQELNPTGRNDHFYRHDLDSRRSNLTRSQEFDSIRRSNDFRDQGLGFTRRSNLSRSQEFVRPPLPKPKEVVAPRQSLSEVHSAVRVGDYERTIAASQPDTVLRSPMLQSLSGHERLRVRPGQLSTLSSSASPKLSGRHQTLSLDEAPVVDSNVPVSSKTSTVGAITPVAINASQRAAEYSSSRNRNSKDTSAHVAAQPAMSKYLMSKPIDDSQGVNTKANYSVFKIPPIDEETSLIESHKSTQNVGNISTAIQSSWGSSSSKASISSSTTSSSSTATSRPPRKTMPQGGRENVTDDSISSGYEFVSTTEVLEEDRRSTGSLPMEQASQNAVVLQSHTNNGKNTIWSLDSDRSNSQPLDPELLASFEEALELFCADDWCTVRLEEGDAAVTSESNSKLDTSFLPRETRDPCNNLVGEPKSNQYEMLDDHVVKAPSQSATLKKVVSSKVVPVDIQEQKTEVDPLQKFEKKCPPGGEQRCVLYTTSLRGIRKTFEDCSRVRAILQSLDVLIDERDIAMHAEFRQEVTSLAGKSASVPRLFIKGRYIGGGEEVSQLHEEGLLSMLLEGLPRQASQTVCDGCGGMRFMPCSTCSGSCKVVTREGHVTCCKVCNENGLSRCPVCL